MRSTNRLASPPKVVSGLLKITLRQQDPVGDDAEDQVSALCEMVGLGWNKEWYIGEEAALFSGEEERVECEASADVDGGGVGSKQCFKRNGGGEEEENEDKVDDGDRMNEVGEVSNECIESGSDAIVACDGEQCVGFEAPSREVVAS
jgi:hypothetical protein